MRFPTYKSTLPTPGSDVAAFVAGLRTAPCELSTALKQNSYREGRECGLRLPRRLAKRRAARILRERRAALRWGSRGNAEVANPTFASPGFVRGIKPAWWPEGVSLPTQEDRPANTSPPHVKEEGTPEQRSMLESKGWMWAPSLGWMAPTPDDKFDGVAWGATEAIASLTAST